MNVCVCVCICLCHFFLQLEWPSSPFIVDTVFSMVGYGTFPYRPFMVWVDIVQYQETSFEIILLHQNKIRVGSGVQNRDGNLFVCVRARARPCASACAWVHLLFLYSPIVLSDIHYGKVSPNHVVLLRPKIVVDVPNERRMDLNPFFDIANSPVQDYVLFFEIM